MHCWLVMFALMHMQDAMARVAAFSKPDMFITITCDPDCVEI